MAMTLLYDVGDKAVIAELLKKRGVSANTVRVPSVSNG